MKPLRSVLVSLLAWASPLLVLGCSDRTGTLTATDAGRTSAALVGTEGDVTLSTSAPVNAYAALASDAAATSTTLLLAAGGAARFSAGDLALVLQAQGATINATDDATYGSVTAYNNAGRYELIHVTAVSVATNSLTLAAPGLRFGYTAAGRTQVVRVPEYRNLTVSAAGHISAPAWDGVTGGVVALHVRDTLTVDGSVDVSGLGFRGGAVRTTADNSILNISLYRTDQAINGGAKGEGIAGFGPEYDLLNGRFGRGAPANAGGGGNAHNAGGGGGANVAAAGLWTGQGVMDMTVAGGAMAWLLDPQYIANGNAPTLSPGGGRGGYSYSNSDQNALVLGPGQAAWAGDSRREHGGYGGRPLTVDPLQRIFFGGGGGAGDANNVHGGSGGAGAGIIIVIAHRITGAGQFLAQGAVGGGAAIAPNDAPGGGGGGGTILLLAEQIDGVTVAAPGGVGGTQQQDPTVDETEGPGGGGGGGLVAFHGGLASANVAGAAAGTTSARALSEFPCNGATRGQSGVSASVPDAWGGVINLPGDLGVVVNNGTATLAPGATATYTITVSNAGPNQIPRATLAAAAGGTVPLTGATWTCTAAGSSSACAAATGTGLPGGTFDIAPGETVTYVVTGTVDPAATSGTLSLAATAAVPTGYDDPTTANDSATDSDLVASQADLITTLTANPTSVIATGNVTLQLNVTNNGPSSAAAPTATVTLASGATLVSAAGNGWTCLLAGLVATCTRPTLAAGSAPIAVVMTTPAIAGTTLVTANASASTADPNGSNNQSSVSVTVTPNTPPTATSDTFSVPANSAGNVLNVLANDTTTPDIGETLTITALTSAAHGTLTNNGGTGLLYTPTAGYTGLDMAMYTVADGHGGTASGTVTINVVTGGLGGAGGNGAGGNGAGGNGGQGATGGNGGRQGGAGGSGGSAAGSNGAAGSGAAGTMGTGGTNTAGSNGAAGNGAAGNGTAGNGTAGNGTAGNGAGGSGGVAGAGATAAAGAGGSSGAAGQGGAAGSGVAGQGNGGDIGSGGVGGATNGHGGRAGGEAGDTGKGGAGAVGGEATGGSAGAGGSGSLDVDNDGLVDEGVSVRGGGCSCDTSGTTTPTSLGLTLGLAALVLAGSRRRPRVRASLSRRRRNATVVSLLALPVLLVATHNAGAQTTPQPNTSIPIERFGWSIDRQGLLNVEWGRTPDAGTFSLGLWGNYANDPLVITRTSDKVRLGSLVHNRLDGGLLASIALFDRLQLGVILPLIGYQTGERDIPDATVNTLPKLASIGIGDLVVMPKIGIVRGDDDGFSLALVPTVGIPTSQGKDYFGEKSVWLAPELAASMAAGGFRIAANVGYHWRKNHPRLADLKVDDEVFGLLGIGYRFGLSENSRRRPLELDLTTSGASSKENLFHGRNRNPVEADAALQIDIVEAFTFMLGGGIGLLPGFGDPDFRLFAGLRLNIFPAAPVPVDDDPDKDGIRGIADHCPQQPEDKDGFQDRDGCPDPDNDKDGVLDVKDKCPNVVGPKENQGCPDNDRDEDGIVDRKDQCPDEAEDKDDFEDEDGCPDPDNDKDGVLDARDKCPNEPGPKENQGCPDKDRDGDGIIDRLDNCPDEPGEAANNGCKKKQLARITEHGIEILDTVYFQTDKAVIQKKSFRLLDNVAAVILAHPEAGVIRVEGHTDSQGDDRHNQDLSEKRANSVVEYLARQGVPPERLIGRGYGETQPLADNKTRAGRAKNRRVVFVMESASGEIKTRDSGPGAN